MTQSRFLAVASDSDSILASLGAKPSPQSRSVPLKIKTRASARKEGLASNSDLGEAIESIHHHC